MKDVRLSFVSFRCSSEKTTKPYMLLYASKLAACAGMHRYVAQDELRQEFRRAQGCPDSAAFVTTEERARAEISALTPAKRQAIEHAVETSYVDAKSAQEAVQSVLDTLSPEEEAHIKPAVCSAVYTRHGQEQEASVRECASHMMSTPIGVDSRFYKSGIPILSIHGIDVYIGGRHDGVVEEYEDDDGSQDTAAQDKKTGDKKEKTKKNKKIVEIKTRQRRFLGTPLYELVQIHAYMFIFNMRRASLVESLNGEMRVHDITFDDDLWSRIQDATAAFVTSCLAEPHVSQADGEETAEE